MGTLDEVCHQRLCGIVSVNKKKKKLGFGHGIPQGAILVNCVF